MPRADEGNKQPGPGDTDADCGRQQEGPRRTGGKFHRGRCRRDEECGRQQHAQDERACGGGQRKHDQERH